MSIISQKKMVKTIFNEFSTFLKNTDLLNREFDNYVQNEFKTICDLFKRKIYRCEVVKPVVLPSENIKVYILFNLISYKIHECLVKNKWYSRLKKSILKEVLEKFESNEKSLLPTENLLISIYDAFYSNCFNYKLGENFSFDLSSQIVSTVLSQYNYIYPKEILNSLHYTVYDLLTKLMLDGTNSKQYFISEALERLVQKNLIFHMIFWDLLSNISYNCLNFLIDKSFIQFKRGLIETSERNLKKGIRKFNREIYSFYNFYPVILKNNLFIITYYITEELLKVIKKDSIGREYSIEGAISLVVEGVFNNFKIMLSDKKLTDFILLCILFRRFSIKDSTSNDNKIIKVLALQSEQCNDIASNEFKEVGEGFQNITGRELFNFSLKEFENLELYSFIKDREDISTKESQIFMTRGRTNSIKSKSLEEQFGFKQKDFYHNKLKYVFRWAPFRHDSESPQNLKLKEFLSRIYENDDIGIFRRKDIILNSCSTFRIKYLKTLSAIKITDELKKKGLIVEFDEFDDNPNIPDTLKNLILTAREVEDKIENEIASLKESNLDKNELKDRIMNIRSMRHDFVEYLSTKSNNNVIAAEVPVWDDSLFITGHIDILLFNDKMISKKIGIGDYKPDVEIGKSYNFLKSLPQVCMYALLLRKHLGFDNIKTYCVSFNRKKGWIYKPDIIFKLPNIIKNHYEQRYFDYDLWDIFGEPKDYDFFDWITLSRMYSLHNPVSDFFNTMRIEIATILKINVHASLDRIALELTKAKTNLKQNTSILDAEKEDFFCELRLATTFLTDNSIKKNKIFLDFFLHYNFNPYIWEDTITENNVKFLKIFNELYKLKRLIIRTHIRRLKSVYAYYILIIVHTLNKVVFSNMLRILKSYYGFYNLSNQGFQYSLNILIDKEFIKKNQDFYVLTNRAKNLIKYLDIKKDLEILYERNKLLLKKKPYAHKFLLLLKKYRSFKVLNDSIIAKIWVKIKDYHGKIINKRTLKKNIDFLYNFNFISKKGTITPLTSIILEDFQNKDIDSSFGDLNEIKFSRSILKAIYSLDYPRFSYIKFYLDKVKGGYNDKVLLNSLDLLLYCDYIEKKSSLYTLTTKGNDFIVKNQINKNKQLKLYNNIKEFEIYLKKAPHILLLINENNELSKKEIQIRIPSNDSLSGIMKYQAITNNLRALKKMGYIFKNNLNKYELTLEGEELIKNPDFKIKFQNIQNFEVVKPSIEQISEVPSIDEVLSFIISMKFPRFKCIVNIGKQQNISKYTVSRALESLLRGEIIEKDGLIYSVTNSGKDYVLTKNVSFNEDIYIKGIICYFKLYLKSAPLILSNILKYHSISTNNLVELTHLKKKAIYKVFNVLIDMDMVKREKKERIYYYSLTIEGLRICSSNVLHDFLSKFK